ncbi:MAG: (deoxy)nucleoside triphosphate pyrophosphohydrolase [Verrucomicrobiaceae bacterium]|nr:(deoxy)nucleoside triphosphate pyrophosphohydrolase [Verrucomicrobiaceae bacterium]
MSHVSVVCAILRRDDLFLLARRPPGKRLGGLWEFPGGKVEPGELPEAALHRELAEELGCTVRVLAEFAAVDHVYEWGAIRLLPFLCELAPGSTEPVAHEHTELAWSALQDLENYELAPADLPVLQMLLKRVLGPVNPHSGI